jgi:hypothetical protein
MAEEELALNSTYSLFQNSSKTAVPERGKLSAPML